MALGINNKDGLWEKFQAESVTHDLVWTDPAIAALAVATLQTHTRLPLQWVKLINNPSPAPPVLEIRLRDGRKWQLILHERLIDGLVSYNLDPSDQWLRPDTLQFLAPLDDAVIQAYVNSQVDSLDIRPV